jgi:molybdopterin/thiamine biosynthesis adenylyltransferase
MKYVFIVVGVGGTGSLVARDLPKLLLRTESEMVIIDGDNVEEKNMVRQAYQTHDIGENKANALAKKINTFYGNICESVDSYVTKNEITEIVKSKYKSYVPVIIGCVDNNKTRLLLENTFKDLDECIYIDSANSEYSGDVYITIKSDDAQYGKLRSEAYKMNIDTHPTEKSCEAQIMVGNIQYMVTNLKMATVVIEHISALLHGEIKRGVSVVKRFEAIHITPSDTSRE